MSDRVGLSPIRRREFLKSCALCATGMAFGSGVLRAETGGTPRQSGQSSQKPGKWMKEAQFYKSSGANLTCVKCPNFCVLGPGEEGKCRNRVNLEGKLYSNAYGNPCALHIDPIEKKPFYHFLPTARAFSIATAGCNLRCLNCQNWEISQVRPGDTQNYDLPPERVVEECVDGRCETIAYTYSEPTTFYEYVLDTAALARKRGIRNLLKSNGYINEEPLRKLCAVLDAANIDLKSYDDAVYRKLSSARRDPVLKTLRVLREERVWLEVTNLVIPGWTDDLETIKRMADWYCSAGLAEAPLHFSRFSPLYKLSHLPATPVSRLEEARETALAAGVKYVYIGNVPGHQSENTYCSKCGRVVIRRRGYVISERHIEKGRCGYCSERVAGVWA